MIVARSKVPGDAHFEPTMERKSAEQRKHFRYLRRICPTAKDLEISLLKAFSEACKEVPSVSVRRSVLGGTPCLEQTRIPVYMVLDALEYYGTLSETLKSYPQLTLEQIKAAVRFAKLVMECPVDNKIETSY